MWENDAFSGCRVGAVDVYVLLQRFYFETAGKKCFYFIPHNLNHSEWH